MTSEGRLAKCQRYYCNSLFTAILITTGYPLGNGHHSEVIDLKSRNHPLKCNLLDKNPLKRWGSVGGLLRNKPVICGGWNKELSTRIPDVFRECYVIGGDSR